MFICYMQDRIVEVGSGHTKLSCFVENILKELKRQESSSSEAPSLSRIEEIF